MSKSFRTIAPLALAALMTAATVDAQNRPMPNVYDDGNRWLITAYDDTSPGHTELATQGLCFSPYAAVGTHIQGRWYSDTFHDWNGRYSQEGDQVVMHGDYADDIGHDGITFEIVTSDRRNEGAGHWIEWREDGAAGNTVAVANAKLRRVGKCKRGLDLIAPLPVIAPRLRVDGGIAQFPMERGQAPLDLDLDIKLDLPEFNLNLQ